MSDSVEVLVSFLTESRGWCHTPGCLESVDGNRRWCWDCYYAEHSSMACDV